MSWPQQGPHLPSHGGKGRKIPTYFLPPSQCGTFQTAEPSRATGSKMAVRGVGRQPLKTWIGDSSMVTVGQRGGRRWMSTSGTDTHHTADIAHLSVPLECDHPSPLSVLDPVLMISYDNLITYDLLGEF